MARFARVLPRVEHRERTLVLLKPDAVQRALVGEILGRFEKKGLMLGGMKLLAVPRTLAEQHYEEHAGRPFFARACRLLGGGPSVALVLQGREAVSTVRGLIGATDPAQANAGTIRGDFAVHWRRNLVHASKTREEAEREVGLWFCPEELVDWVPAIEPYVHEVANAPTSFESDHPGHLYGDEVVDPLPMG
jgi:nucleoside-diphosphate kinase